MSWEVYALGCYLLINSLGRLVRRVAAAIREVLDS